MPTDTERHHKAIVLEAFDTLFNERNYTAAEHFWSPDYIQHSAHIAPGRDGLFDLVRAAPPDLRYENALIVAEGDYVMLHGRFSNTGRPANWIAVDIVRMHDGRLAEHWDVLQDEVTADQSQSGLPMFGEHFPLQTHTGPEVTLTLSAQFATSMQSPQHIAIAEEVGYTRAWLFDTPHQSPDVWMILALAAERTTQIGLGPGVLVPKLRHPMVNASAAAALAALAPGRVAVAFGTGFTGARALGTTPTTWAYLRDYVRTFRTLLNGDQATWDGSILQMLHPPELHGLDIPVLISALGPKGIRVATELADGLFSVNGETTNARDFEWSTLGIHGTVLAAGEELNSARVRAAAGPGNALAYHAAYEFGGDVTALPGGQAWLDHIEAVPQQQRHLAVHDRHLTELNAADEAAWTAGAWQAIPTTTVTGTAGDIAAQLNHYAAQGVTEVIYQPTGPDIPGELAAFITAAQPALSTAQAAS